MLANSKLHECSTLRSPVPIKDATEPSSNDCEGVGKYVLEVGVGGEEEWSWIQPPLSELEVTPTARTGGFEGWFDGGSPSWDDRIPCCKVEAIPVAVSGAFLIFLWDLLLLTVERVRLSICVLGPMARIFSVLPDLTAQWKVSILIEIQSNKTSTSQWAMWQVQTRMEEWTLHSKWCFLFRIKYKATVIWVDWWWEVCRRKVTVGDVEKKRLITVYNPVRFSLHITTLQTCEHEHTFKCYWAVSHGQHIAAKLDIHLQRLQSRIIVCSRGYHDSLSIILDTQTVWHNS